MKFYFGIMFGILNFGILQAFPSNPTSASLNGEVSKARQ